MARLSLFAFALLPLVTACDAPADSPEGGAWDLTTDEYEACRELVHACADSEGMTCAGDDACMD